MTRCLSSAAVSVLETTVWPAGRGRGRRGGGVFHTPSAEGGVLGAAAPLAPTLTERCVVTCSNSSSRHVELSIGSGSRK